MDAGHKARYEYRRRIAGQAAVYRSGEAHSSVG